MISLIEASRKIIKDYFEIKREERFLIVFDKNKTDIAKELIKAAYEFSDNVVSLEIPIGKINGEEPPKEAHDAMMNCNACIMITTVSYSHTKARREACKKGARIATMPGITEEILCRTLDVDYNEVVDMIKKWKKILDNGSIVRVTTEKGTDVSMSIEGRYSNDPEGYLNKPGAFGNLPFGEAFLAPVEGMTFGKLVVDGSFLKEKVDQDVVITIQDGYALDIKGGTTAGKLCETLAEIKDRNAYNIAELGIGTNKAAIVTGNTLEDEKSYGTAHIALGNNKSFGGNVDVPIHLDGVFHKPTIYVDNKKIMEKGILLQENLAN